MGFNLIKSHGEEWGGKQSILFLKGGGFVCRWVRTRLVPVNRGELGAFLGLDKNVMTRMGLFFLSTITCEFMEGLGPQISFLCFSKT